MPEFKAVQLKRSVTAGVVPSAAQLVDGELAINLADRNLYSKNGATVFQVLPGAGSLNYDRLSASAVTAILSAVYPVGSIYTNATNSANPATVLGFGTWTAFAAGRVAVGFDSTNPLFDATEETGGSADATVVSHTHTATTNTTGAHGHSASLTQSTKSGNGPTSVVSSSESLVANYAFSTASAGDHSHTVTVASTGSSGTNANYQPYITVYMWKRTA